MGLSKEHFKIAEILAAFFTNTQTDRDQKICEEWEKERESYRDLVQNVLDWNNYIRFEATANRFDQQEGWEVFKDYLATKSDVSDNKGRVKSIVKRMARYAAVGLILIAGSVFYWMNQPVKKEQETVFAYRIEAGKTGARLTMADGKVMDIVKDQTFLLKESDGTVIMADSTGIGYQIHEVKNEKEVRNTIQTLTGMEYSLTLSDGTKVYLNAESKLSFPVSFKGAQRIVALSGEAYFDVAKDAERPFVIETRDLSVKVLGTSFNLRAYDDEKAVTTTLASGKVQVFDGRQFEDITSGEQVVYEKATKAMVVNKVDVAHHVAWRTGRFVFRNERLEDIMVYLARWYHVKYQFVDEGAKNIRIGAKLNRYDNMNPIIDMLKMNSLMEIALRDSVYLISSKK